MWVQAVILRALFISPPGLIDNESREDFLLLLQFYISLDKYLLQYMCGNTERQKPLFDKNRLKIYWMLKNYFTKTRIILIPQP